MSTKAVGWALEQQVGSPAAKLVLVGLAEHADRETWVAWPSRTTCATYAECTPRSVTNHFRELISAGHVSEVSFDELLEVHDELAERFASLPPDRRPRLWLINPNGAGGNAFQSRVENRDRAGGKTGGNGFHQNKTKPSVKTAGSNVPDAEQTAAMLAGYREGKTNAKDNVTRLRSIPRPNPEATA